MEYTLIDANGDHQYYLTGEPETGYQILYFDRSAKRVQWFNGRYHTPFTVTAKKDKTGWLYTMPRKTPEHLYISPSLMESKEPIKILDVFNCPITAITGTSTHHISFAKSYSLGDAKSPTRETWAALVETHKPQQIVLHLPALSYNAEISDFSKFLFQLSEFSISIRNWFYSQKRKIITPKNKNYTPQIIVQIDDEATNISELTESDIKTLFKIKEVAEYYEQYSNYLPTKENWLFLGHQYITIDGEPVEVDETTTEKVIQILLDVYRLRINQVTDESEVWSRAENQFIDLDEKMIRSIKIRLNEEFKIKINKDTLQEIIFSNWQELLLNKKIERPTFHPYQDYFLNLGEWDGQDNIKQLFEALVIAKINVPVRDFSPETLDHLRKILPETAFNDTFIDWRSASLHYFKKWIVGIVVQALTKRDVNALMPILTGATNRGKSTYIKYLLPPDLEPYLISSGVVPSVSNYETAVNLRSSLLINFDDEADSWPRHYWKSLKTMITTPYVNYRAKYDKLPQSHKRTCSFIATTNFPDILNDPTGTRRFIMLPVVDIERNFWERINLDQVWAQAVHLALKTKLPINLSKSELELLQAANSVFFEESTEEQVLSEHLTPITDEQAAEEIRQPDTYKAYDPLIQNGPIVLMREVDIMNYLTNQSNSQKLQTKDLRTALQKLGFKSISCFKQRTFKERRNQRCYAVQLNNMKPPVSNEPDTMDRLFH